MTDAPKKKKKSRKALKIVLICIAVLLVLCIAAGVYLWFLWKNGDRFNRETMFVTQPTTEITLQGNEDEPNAEPSTSYDGRPTIKHNGAYYVLNENVFSVLFMGIDVNSEEQFANIGSTAHQSDTLFLLVVDPTTSRFTVVNIPRMTITDVKQLDMNFNYARTTKSPICIQYSFGDGKELSCTLTRDAVSNLLFNIPISRYVSMNLDGLYIANDAVGGITLKLLDDMTAFNPKMKKGEEYTLKGKDVEIYLSRRLGEGLDGTNMSRTARQIQYCKQFFKVAKEKIEANPLFVVELYNALGGTIQSDLSVEEMIYLSKSVSKADLGDENIYSLEGTVKNEDFFVDDDALKDLLIDLFYTKVA